MNAIHTNKNIGQSIFNQLGGQHKLIAMVGAERFGVTDNGCVFHFKGSWIANCACITLNSNDLYDVEFLFVKGTKVKAVSKVCDILVGNLRSTFENETKLRITLA